MLKKDEKKLCADRLVEMIEDLKDFGYEDKIEIFRTSETFEQLYNFKTRLWTKGPDYIVGLFAKEMGIKIHFL